MSIKNLYVKRSYWSVKYHKGIKNEPSQTSYPLSRRPRKPGQTRKRGTGKLMFITKCFLTSPILKAKKIAFDLYNLRNTQTDLALPMPEKDCGKRCFSCMGASLWNNLPLGTKLSESPCSFKTI